MTSVQSMLGSRLVRRWIWIWYETAVWCWSWYRYGYRYLPFRHLATLGRWQWMVCWNEFRKYTNIVPCDIGLVLDTSMVCDFTSEARAWPFCCSWIHGLDSQESLRQKEAKKPAQADAIWATACAGFAASFCLKLSWLLFVGRCAGLGRLKCRLVSTAKKDFPEGCYWLFPRYCLSEQWQCDGLLKLSFVTRT